MSNKEKLRDISVLSTQSSSLTVSIADITYSIISFDSSLKIKIEGATQKFLIHGGNHDVTIEARWDDLSDNMYHGNNRIFDSGALWQLYNYHGKYLFSFTSPVFGSIPYKIALVEKDFTRGEVLLHRPYFNKDQPVYPLEYPLDELLLINYLAFGKGVEIHACGVVDIEGRGHLFIGQSGAGKTTIARLWQDEPGVTVLSDDRIILRKIDDTIWMYGTPWHGDAGFASLTRAPLRKIYFLRHGQRNELLPQGLTEALAHLFACSFPLFYNREAIDFSLTFLESVVTTVPCYELWFIPDIQVIKFLKYVKK